MFIGACSVSKFDILSFVFMQQLACLCILPFGRVWNLAYLWCTVHSILCMSLMLLIELTLRLVVVCIGWKLWCSCWRKPWLINHNTWTVLEGASLLKPDLLAQFTSVTTFVLCLNIPCVCKSDSSPLTLSATVTQFLFCTVMLDLFFQAKTRRLFP